MPSATPSIVRTRAVLLRKTSYQEADLVLLFFTEALGKLSAIARSARASKRRFGGSLEPLHGLTLELTKSPRQSGLFVLNSAAIDKPRIGLSESLKRMNAAGRLLGWLRLATAEQTPENAIYDQVDHFLDSLDAPGADDPKALLGGCGLQLLAGLGWGIDFMQCVQCGRRCPEGKAARINARKGGLVCARCGGASKYVAGPQRHRLALATQGASDSLLAEDAPLCLELVEMTLEAHANIGRELTSR